jgi:hypothetical protein
LWLYILLEEISMNKRTSLVMLLLVLPLVLAACGGGPTDNAENFLEALNDNDQEEAEKYICDDQKNSFFMQIYGRTVNMAYTDARDVECEAFHDDVKCTMTVDADNEEQIVTMTLGIEDEKVCTFKNVRIDPKDD